MSKIHRLILSVGVLALCACGNHVVSSSQAVVKETAAERVYRVEFEKAANQFRNSQGKSSLPNHSGIAALARNHSAFQQVNRGKFGVNGKNISHEGFTYRATIAEHKYQMSNLGENVAAGKRVSPQGAVRLLAGSPIHRANMLNTWTHTGVGVVMDHDGTVFITQLFGSYSNTPLGKDLTNPSSW